MEFGKVPASELAEINFSLPADPAFNKVSLKTISVSQPKIFIGCPRWGRKEWLGKIYPPRTKEKDFLKEYVNHFNSIELNATHYRLYDDATIKKWADLAGSTSFLFCPKMYKGITNIGSLAGKETLTLPFIQSMFNFKMHLGPILIQLSEGFSPDRQQELFDFLETLPVDLCFFIEVRHPAFFEHTDVTLKFFTRLRELNIGAVITDTAGRRDCAHMYLTVPRAFIRYVGNSLDGTDYTRIDAWVERIKLWLDNGLKELYFFMHMHNETTSPDLTLYLINRLNSECGLNLQTPGFLPAQG